MSHPIGTDPTLEVRVAALEVKVARQRLRIDEDQRALSDTLIEHGAKLDHVMAGVADLRTRMGKLETDVAGLKTDVAGHTAALDRIEQMLVALLERGIEK